MHKLLVPYDGSDNAKRALAYAIRLAKEHGPMPIHVVYAHEEPRVYGEISVYIPAEKMKAMQDQHCEAVLAGAEAPLQAAGVPWTKEVLTGHVGEVIARRADELGCDAIVMGSRGLSPIGSLLMGSVATRVVHFARVPVTLVK